MAQAISGTNVVWQRWAGSDWEIYSNFAGRLTDNARADNEPRHLRGPTWCGNAGMAQTTKSSATSTDG